MKQALNGIEPDLINCHATSTPAGDLSEVRAIASLGSDADIVADKSSLGHTFGAAGAIESILAIKCMQEVMS